jgi:hypothetical protein
MKELEITIGQTSTAENPHELAEALSKHLKKRQNDQRRPLAYAEFSRLLESGSNTRIPDRSDPFLYRGDKELALSDSAINAQYADIEPVDFRTLRKGFIYKKTMEIALERIEYEKDVLNHAHGKRHQKGQVTHSDYLEYLSAFHGEDLATFFRPWALPVSGRDLKAHAYIAARSGHGKSELIKTMLYGLLKEGQGTILFDPHGDIAEQVVKWQEFAEDPSRLVYFSPYLAGGRLEIVPVINPLAPLHQAQDLDSAVENFIGVVSAVVGGDFDMSVRMKMLLRPCLYTLAAYPETTIYDLIEFMAESPIGDDKKTQPTPWVDKARALLTNRAQQDILRTFFDKTYDTTKAAIRDRLRTFLASHGLDRCLAGESTIDLSEAMDAGKFIVFNLSRGKLGDETSSIFGRFLLAAIQNAAMQRQEQKADERRPVFTFIDEADRLLSDSVVSIYKETRKYGLHLAIAQQITGFGMSGEMKRAVFGNSNVRIAGAGGGDVETTRDLATMTGIDRAEIERLPSHVFYARRGASEAVRFTVPSMLADGRNAMSADDWERVKAYQIFHYYRDHQTGAAPTYAGVTPSHKDRPPIMFN